jgi:phosphate:Na+ symporter
MELGSIHYIFVVLTAIILFLYGLESFSREVYTIGEERFRGMLGRLTSNRFVAFSLGGAVTAVLQSSSAVSVLAVALVNAKILPFVNCLAILLGAKVGTTLTAHLVAFNLMQLGPVFIVLGFMLSLLKVQWSVVGKAVFYFGFIFFSLDLISKTLLPLREAQEVVDLLSSVGHPVWAILAGILVTVVVQSSSVTTGLTILLVQQNQLAVEQAIPIVLGANVGTTATALIASIRMDILSRRAAVGNLLFNVIGVVMFFPFLGPFTAFVAGLSSDPSHSVANGYLIFNASLALPFLLLLHPFARLLERLVR